MATITLSFTNKNGRFCLCAYTTGKKLRHYKTVDELVTPNFKKWDQKSQKFTSRSENDRYNNQILKRWLEKYHDLLKQRDFESGQDLFAYQEVVAEKDSNPKEEIQKKQKTQSGITLGEWVQQIVDDMFNPTRLKPTGSYQAYKSLLRKFERERKLIQLPVAAINDDSFMQFAKWINAQKPVFKNHGNNYVKTMQAFRAVMNRAQKARLTTYTPNFPYMDYAPIQDTISDNAQHILINGGAVKSLTSEQYDAFLNMDLSDIKMNGGAIAEKYKAMYRDFCILLYEMKSRPIDIIKLHQDNIAFDAVHGRYTCTYIPAKKKNYGRNSHQTSNPLVIQYLSPEAVRIIMKYQGQAGGGYVFPFGLNQKRWNLDKPTEFHTHYNQANRLEGRINAFLHKVGKKLGLPFQLTLYAFRRTAITHAIIDNKIPLPIIAKMAGTSVDMIDKHYANYLHTLAAY